MESNPLTLEIVEQARDLISPDSIDATNERMGGREVVDQLVLHIRNSVAENYPAITVLGVDGLAVVEIAVYTGMAAGVAAERRARKGDELMREWGLE